MTPVDPKCSICAWNWCFVDLWIHVHRLLPYVRNRLGLVLGDDTFKMPGTLCGDRATTAQYSLQKDFSWSCNNFMENKLQNWSTIELQQKSFSTLFALWRNLQKWSQDWQKFAPDPQDRRRISCLHSKVRVLIWVEQLQRSARRARNVVFQAQLQRSLPPSSGRAGDNCTPPGRPNRSCQSDLPTKAEEIQPWNWTKQTESLQCREMNELATKRKNTVHFKLWPFSVFEQPVFSAKCPNPRSF